MSATDHHAARSTAEAENLTEGVIGQVQALPSDRLKREPLKRPRRLGWGPFMCRRLSNPGLWCHAKRLWSDQ
jgi:hypothetical protein